MIKDSQSKDILIGGKCISLREGNICNDLSLLLLMIYFTYIQVWKIAQYCEAPHLEFVVINNIGGHIFRMQVEVKNSKIINPCFIVVFPFRTSFPVLERPFLVLECPFPVLERPFLF